MDLDWDGNQFMDALSWIRICMLMTIVFFSLTVTGFQASQRGLSSQIELNHLEWISFLIQGSLNEGGVKHSIIRKTTGNIRPVLGPSGDTGLLDFGDF